VINEVAWAGTAASANDEWIELLNTTAAPFNLAGWTLSDGGDINLTFGTLVIEAQGFLLLERTDDNSVSDIPADLIYTGGLSNSGEILTLRDAAGNVIDTVNGSGGWPAGDSGLYASMERSPDNAWHGNYGHVVNGRDADGTALRATPRQPNSCLFPTPTPLPYPTGILLNEFLPHPGSGAQEFIEIVNGGAAAVDLTGWRLDDMAGGSAPYTLPGGTRLEPGQFLVFFRDVTGLVLNDDGDTARLLWPDGSVADEWIYESDPKANNSWARLPDGGAWNDRGQPTPGQSNRRWPDPTAVPVPQPAIGELRQWSTGAWARFTGRVTVPPRLFGKQVFYMQDETGGIAVYLGRGDWPALAVGQSVTAFGYLRQRNGELQFYVRHDYDALYGPEYELVPPQPRPVTTGQIGEAAEGWLVTTTGRVTKLEAGAFWIDDGSGPARVFFSSATGVKRPAVTRGQWWTVTGVVVEYTTPRSAAATYRLQPRFASDAQLVSDAP